MQQVESLDIKQDSTINRLALLFCLFPFVLRTIPTDLQPWAFILILLRSIMIPKERLSYSWAVLFVVSSLIILYRLRFNYDLFDTARSIPVYFTPVFLVLLFRSNFISADVLSKFLKITLIIYFAYGFLQKYDLDPLSFNDIRPAFDRGVRSLTPEPSMFGYVSTLLMLSLLILEKATALDWIVYTCNMLLSLSMSAILAGLPLIFIAIFYSSSKLKLTFVTAFLLWLIFSDEFSLLYTERVLQLTSLPIRDLIVLDGSINERLGHLNYIFSQPLHYILGGSNGWGIDFSNFIKQDATFIQGSNSNNILSGLGNVIYDGGLLGIMYLYLLFHQGYRVNNKLYTRDIIIIVVWVLVALQSISLAVPLLSLPIGCFILRCRYPLTNLTKVDCS